MGDEMTISERGTPLTDAAEVKMQRLDGDFDHVVAAEFARRLEQGLAEAMEALEWIASARNSTYDLDWAKANAALAAIRSHLGE